jgi:peptidoglycan-associated lipoprotein
MTRYRCFVSILLMSAPLALSACASHTTASTTTHPPSPASPAVAEGKPLPPPPEFQSSKGLQAFGSDLAASDGTKLIPPQETVLFDVDSYALTPQAQADLDDAARWLIAHPQRIFVIEGHADQAGSDAHNLELSRMRAVGVAQYLVDRGAPLERLYVDPQGETGADKKVAFGDRRAVIYAAMRPAQGQRSEGQRTSIQAMQ